MVAKSAIFFMFNFLFVINGKHWKIQRSKIGNSVPLHFQVQPQKRLPLATCHVYFLTFSTIYVCVNERKSLVHTGYLFKITTCQAWTKPRNPRAHGVSFPHNLACVYPWYSVFGTADSRRNIRGMGGNLGIRFIVSSKQKNLQFSKMCFLEVRY